MKTCYNLIFILLFLVTISCNCQKNKFVIVNNGKFVLEGRPYYFLGTNFWHGAYLGANIVEGDRQRLIRELDLLKSHGITNLRIMASSEKSDLEASVKPAFQNKPGKYNEKLLRGLDYLLTEMAKRNMKAVLVLNNYWQWSGGMSQYMNWVSGKSVIDPDKTGDWDGFQDQSAEFYTDSTCNTLYKKYIKMLISRKNSISGLTYKDDPTIMSWQLANEPRPAVDAANNKQLAMAIKNWVHESAKYIHSLDANHLVSTGNEGVQGSRMDKNIYIETHKSEYIDYLTFHIWPKNWSWFDVNNAESTFVTTLKNTEDYFTEHIEIARQLKKPTVLEEFGMERDNGLFSPTSATKYRNNYLEKLFASVVESAKEGSPMAGLNFWAWGGEAKASHRDYIWREGDSFMGDPPQEPQGLNSVFSTDVSTLEIFKKYNKEIDKLLSGKHLVAIPE